MLYLHGGWPRTGTTSLQAVLFENRQLLTREGMAYPDEWQGRKRGPAHHWLLPLLAAPSESGRELDDFKRFLARHTDKDVLLSAENLTLLLLSPHNEEAMQKLLAAAQEVVPTRCVWTLRRLDDMLRSLYLRRLTLGESVGSAVEHFGKIRQPERIFAALKNVESAVGGDTVYVKYDRAGAHNRELLRALGVPEEIEAEFQLALADGPRRNASPSHKQAVALANVELLSKRAEMDLSAAALRDAVRRGGLEFDRDWRCEPVGTDVRRNLHEKVLAAARQQGFRPYVEFFDDVEIQDPPGPTGLDPDILTDDDLRRLLELPDTTASH